MRPSRLLFELEDSLRAGSEMAQAWQSRSLTLAQLGQNIVNDPIQLVGSFGFRDAFLAGQAFSDFRLLHSDFMVAGESSRRRWPASAAGA